MTDLTWIGRDAVKAQQQHQANKPGVATIIDVLRHFRSARDKTAHLSRLHRATMKSNKIILFFSNPNASIRLSQNIFHPDILAPEFHHHVAIMSRSCRDCVAFHDRGTKPHTGSHHLPPASRPIGNARLIDEFTSLASGPRKFHIVILNARRDDSSSRRNGRWQRVPLVVVWRVKPEGGMRVVYAAKDGQLVRERLRSKQQSGWRAIDARRSRGLRAAGLMKDGEEIRFVINRMHDGQPLAGKIRSAWEGILRRCGPR